MILQTFFVFQSLRLSGHKPLNFLRTPIKRNIFSFFRKGGDKKVETPIPESLESHAELIWSEAKKNLHENKLANLYQNQDQKHALKKSQIRRIKKEVFLDVIQIYLARSGKARRGFNEFILTALDQMKEYEVEDDLEVYKALLNVLPENRLKATSFFHAEFLAYKQQQDTISKLLVKMNANKVMPDDDVGDKIVDVFGWRSHVMTNYRRMMYWVPKLRHANPWPVLEKLPDDLEDNAASIARLVAARICPDPSTEFSTITVPSPCIEPSCLVSAQSVTQRALLSTYAGNCDGDSDSKRFIYLDGPHYVWFRQLQLAYYVLWAGIDPRRVATQFDRKRKSKISTQLRDPSSWDYRILGSDREKLTYLQPVTSTVKKPTSHSDDSSRDALMNMKIVDTELVKEKTALRKKAIWSALSIGHSLAYLPAQLTRHEQAEGSIFAIGVVGPVSNALENQTTVFEWESDNLMKKDDSDSSSTHLPTVPAPASAQLIRNWLKDLRVRNPQLDNVVVVLRGQSCAVEDSFIEDEID